MAGENKAYKSDNELQSLSGGTPNLVQIVNPTADNNFKRRRSDQDLILTDTDDNTGYMEGEESGLYIHVNQSQEYSVIPGSTHI